MHLYSILIKSILQGTTARITSLVGEIAKGVHKYFPTSIVQVDIVIFVSMNDRKSTNAVQVVARIARRKIII